MTDEKLEIIGSYVTVYKAAQLKRTKTGTLYQWLRRHDIPTKRVGKSLLVELYLLEAYNPRRAYIRRGGRD